MSKTDANLMEAFAGESQANRKYLAYAKQADKEGFPQAAKLFRAAAAADPLVLVERFAYQCVQSRVLARLPHIHVTRVRAGKGPGPPGPLQG